MSSSCGTGLRPSLSLWAAMFPTELPRNASTPATSLDSIEHLTSEESIYAVPWL